MAALRDIARHFADEIRDGIAWVIVYRTGRSWHALSVWSDLGVNEWETDDINDALEALRLDPGAVALNGYYCGRFGDMTIDDIVAGIRCHYERGTNALADDDILAQALADIETSQGKAAEAGKENNMKKTYSGIHTGYGCKVDEDMSKGPGGSILVAYYECGTLRETVETALKLLDTNYEVTIFSNGLYNPRSYHRKRSVLEDFGSYIRDGEVVR